MSLVAEDEVPSFIEKVRKEYTAYQGLSDEELGEVIFATQPSNGAFGECWPFGQRGRRADCAMQFLSLRSRPPENVYMEVKCEMYWYGLLP